MEVMDSSAIQDYAYELLGAVVELRDLENEAARFPDSEVSFDRVRVRVRGIVDMLRIEVTE